MNSQLLQNKTFKILKTEPKTLKLRINQFNYKKHY